jgi:hemolysin activation/secretion protein
MFFVANRTRTCADFFANKKCALAGLALMSCLGSQALAAPPPGADAEANRQQQEQLLREQERQQQYQRQTQPPVDVHLDGPEAREDLSTLPTDETPCFPIHELVLNGDAAARFQFALDKAIARTGYKPGTCLGVKGINALMKLTQNAVIARGYTTTRILVAHQDLKTGRLAFTVVPGRIHAIRFDRTDEAQTHANRIARFANELPASAGDILNLRDLEQALENFKRVPTADADIQIVPAETANESDVVIRWRQRDVPFRVMLGIDDGGLLATGRYQGNVTLFADSPLGLSDLFYVSYNHHVFHAPREKDDWNGHTTRSGTRGASVHYSVPFGNYLVSFNHGAYRYHQAIAGVIENYDYNGKSEFSDIGLTRTMYRDASRKTNLGLRLWRRESRNYIDDAEIDIQHRRTVGWALNAEHKEFFKTATATFGLGYRRGTGAGHSLRAPEEDTHEGTSHFQIVTADAALNWPFTLAKEIFVYDGSVHAQWNGTRLVLQDRLSIGGRYSVRGFDGETTFAGERGWVWRNALGWQYRPAHQIYLAADMGRVEGPSTRTLPGKTLAGAVVGIKGQFQPGGKLWYDLFIGGPLHKPSRFKTDSTVIGFGLNYLL